MAWKDTGIRLSRVGHSVEGVDLAVVAARSTNLAWEMTLAWVWPVTTVEDWHIPGGLARLVDTWADRCRKDPTGLAAPQDLLQ